MRLLITGLSGTLAPVLADAARAAGHAVLGWDRQHLPPADEAASLAWLDRERPDAIAHLATGGPPWAALLARWAAERAAPLVMASTAMVFDHLPDGPHHPHDERTARDDYGRGKVACEDAVLAAHPGASAVRFGWQIDPARPGNNMLVQLDGWQRDQGEVAASRAWVPACSFMADTAAAMLALLQAPRPGVVHLDSNAGEGWRFDQIVVALAAQFGRDGWRIRVHDDYRHDQRLAGGDAIVPPLSARLPGLLRTTAA